MVLVQDIRIVLHLLTFSSIRHELHQLATTLRSDWRVIVIIREYFTEYYAVIGKKGVSQNLQEKGGR